MSLRLWLILLLPLLLTAVFWWLVKYLWAILFDPKHGRKLAVSLDQLANTVLNGSMDETISSRAGRAIRDNDKRNTWWACPLCYVLDKLDKNHCKKSIGV